MVLPLVRKNKSRSSMFTFMKIFNNNIIPRARMGFESIVYESIVYESIVYEAEGRMGKRCSLLLHNGIENIS